MKDADIDIVVLRAVKALQPNAYGVTIHQKLGNDISLGAIYLAIDRLEAKRIVSTRRSDPTPERGNRPKLFVFVVD